MALKLRQQAEREERRLRLMRQEQDRVNSEIADLQGSVKVFSCRGASKGIYRQRMC